MSKLISNTIMISELLTDEAEIVRQLLIESYRQYKEHFSPQGWKEYAKKIASSVDNPNVDKILVAKLDQQILGSLQLFQSAEKAYEKPELDIHAPIIRLLAVHPAARGYGVGKALLKTVLHDAEADGEANVFLHTTDFMVDAIHLYTTFGFKRDESRDYWREKVHCKCYRFDL